MSRFGFEGSLGAFAAVHDSGADGTKCRGDTRFLCLSAVSSRKRPVRLGFPLEHLVADELLILAGEDIGLVRQVGHQLLLPVQGGLVLAPHPGQDVGALE